MDALRWFTFQSCWRYHSWSSDQVFKCQTKNQGKRNWYYFDVHWGWETRRCTGTWRKCLPITVQFWYQTSSLIGLVTLLPLVLKVLHLEWKTFLACDLLLFRNHLYIVAETTWYRLVVKSQICATLFSLGNMCH